ncbi:MAG: hypothetical protein QM708_04590 [Propioniciclava sp.]|uniref:hypothetical protein n=1 Tax=Propioniciclava sp. TaxID=2038686 RepID=UPI0039E23414
MSDLILASAVKAEIALNELQAKLAERRERGADILEYVGMVLLAAVIIGGVFGIAGDLDLAEKFSTAANKILGIGG